MNNSEDVSRLVDNLKELNNELEKMNANFKNNILSDTASCFDDLSSKASNLANSLGLVAESEEFLKTVGKKLQPEVEDVDEVLSGVLGTASSFLNVIPMIEIGVTAASIAFDVLHEALRDKSMDKYYESCVKVASELSSFTKGIEDAVSMFDGFDNEDLIDAKAVQRRAQTLTDLERMTYESLQQIMHDAEEIRANEIKKLEEDYSYKLALIEKEYMDENNIMSQAGKDQIEILENEINEKIADEEAYYRKTLEIATNGYLQQISLDDDYRKKKQAHLDELKQEEIEYNARITEIDNDANLDWFKRKEQKAIEYLKYHNKMNKLNEDYYKDLVIGNEKEIASLMSLTMETIKYGGDISDETEAFINDMIDNWDLLPEETKEIMKNVLEPMVKQMEKEKPELFAQADSIANGILNKLKSAFKIQSPSKKTREIFRFLMEGCELGLEDEKNHLLGITDDISGSVLDRLSCVGDMHSAVMGSSIGRMNSASVNESNLSVMNRIAQSRGVIQTVLNIDGREFAVATSGYMKEEMAFIR